MHNNLAGNAMQELNLKQLEQVSGGGWIISGWRLVYVPGSKIQYPFGR